METLVSSASTKFQAYTAIFSLYIAIFSLWFKNKLKIRNQRALEQDTKATKNLGFTKTNVLYALPKKATIGSTP